MARYVLATALMTLLWGLVFGALDDALGEPGNWLYAFGVGLMFAALIGFGGSLQAKELVPPGAWFHLPVLRKFASVSTAVCFGRRSCPSTSA